MKRDIIKRLEELEKKVLPRTQSRVYLLNPTTKQIALVNSYPDDIARNICVFYGGFVPPLKKELEWEDIPADFKISMALPSGRMNDQS